MLAVCQLMEEATAIKVERVDFSDPEGSKGPCDRKAATIQAHVLRYIGDGRDVVSADDLKGAILSHGGVRGVSVTLVNLRNQPPPISVQGKLEGVSTLNNFHYGNECLTVWKAFDVGNGKTIPWSQFQEAFNRKIVGGHAFNLNHYRGESTCRNPPVREETQTLPEDYRRICTNNH
ncbi:hypothetical protein ACROYT_G014995 [Oculina patagonica]